MRPLLAALLPLLALGAAAEEPPLTLAVAGFVGQGESVSIAPDVSRKLARTLLRARSSARFVEPKPGTEIDGAASLAKARDCGRASGADKVILGKVLYRFDRPAPPPPRVTTTQRVETQWVDAEHTETVANPEYEEWKEDPWRGVAGAAANEACGRGVAGLFCGAAASALTDKAPPPKTVARTVKTKVPKTVVVTEQREEPRDDSDVDKILALRIMYAVVDVPTGAVEHKDVVDYKDTVPAIFESMESDQERKAKAVEKILPALEDSIVRAAPRLKRRAGRPAVTP
jgi:hypothetical protein